MLSEELQPADSQGNGDEKDAKAMETILSSAMISDQLEYYLICETTKVVWDQLCHLLEEHSEASKSKLLDKISSV